MLNALRQFLADLGGAEKPVPAEGHDERLAAAALLFHVVAVDGVVSGEERAILRDALMRHFQLDGAAADRLVTEAAAADRESVDLYGFTSILKARLDQAGRERVIEMMWRMVFADGAMHEFEDNVVWRVAELLGVPSRDRLRLKKAAQSPGDD